MSSHDCCHWQVTLAPSHNHPVRVDRRKDTNAALHVCVSSLNVLSFSRPADTLWVNASIPQLLCLSLYLSSYIHHWPSVSKVKQHIFSLWTSPAIARTKTSLSRSQNSHSLWHRALAPKQYSCQCACKAKFADTKLTACLWKNLTNTLHLFWLCVVVFFCFWSETVWDSG